MKTGQLDKLRTHDVSPAHFGRTVGRVGADLFFKVCGSYDRAEVPRTYKSGPHYSLFV
jgi:hypothetical protein